MSAPARELPIYSSPAVCVGQPMVKQGVGVRVVDLLGRFDAGESIEHVARDFGVEPGSLELLVELREVLR